MFKLGIIGAGHMGMTILAGAVSVGAAAPRDISVYDIAPDRVDAAREKGYVPAESARAVYENCKYVLLAVLPQNAGALLSALSANTENKPVVVSIVSGMSSSFIQKHLGAGTKVICVVPNLTLSVGEGATAISHTENVTDEMMEPVMRVFGGLGRAVIVEEKLLKEIIPANGCAPGYAFYMIDAVAKAAEARGVDYPVAIKMAATAFGGAAKMILNSDKQPEELLARVCSPGGLTEKGVNYFNEHKLNEIIMRGAWESANRGRELALD